MLSHANTGCCCHADTGCFAADHPTAAAGAANHMVQVLAGSRALRRLMIGSTNLTGTVPCALFEEHTLKTLMMSSNKLEGTLPDCVFQVRGVCDRSGLLATQVL